MSDDHDAPRYQIETLKDMLDIPAERVDAFLEDLRRYLQQGQALLNSLNAVAKSDTGREELFEMAGTMIWIDDGKHDQQYNLPGGGSFNVETSKDDEPQPPSGRWTATPPQDRHYESLRADCAHVWGPDGDLVAEVSCNLALEETAFERAQHIAQLHNAHAGETPDFHCRICHWTGSEEEVNYDFEEVSAYHPTRIALCPECDAWVRPPEDE